MVLANLSMEMGAKVAFTPVDEPLIEYLRPRAGRPIESIAPDPDAVYERVLHIDLAADVPEPQIACPHSVDNVKPLSELGEVPVEQAVLGSPAPTAGWRISKLRRASLSRPPGPPAHAPHRDPGLAADLSRGHAAGLPGDSDPRRARW
jgi:3-isopropylmalate/(R)-2-methylmalate dehydratase large subunit